MVFLLRRRRRRHRYLRFHEVCSPVHAPVLYTCTLASSARVLRHQYKRRLGYGKEEVEVAKKSRRIVCGGSDRLA